MNNEMLEECKRLCTVGFQLHWLYPKSKRPVRKGWQIEMRQGWGALRNFYHDGNNLGVVLGSELKGGGYLAVIDCDMKTDKREHQDELTVALKGLGIKGAPCVLSGRGNGSRHFYVRTEKPLTPVIWAKSKEVIEGSRRAAWEIGLMGKGQQVVLPPSIHPDTGKAYAWHGKGLVSLDDIPMWSPPPGAVGEAVAADNGEATGWEGFNVVGYDLFSLSAKSMSALVEGGVTDRSEAMFNVVSEMVGLGWCNDEILSACTDVDNILAAVGYDHAQTKNRQRAGRWVFKYCLAAHFKKRSVAAKFKAAGPAKREEVTEEDREEQEASVKGDGPGDDWLNDLDKSVREGKPTATFRNIKMILEKTMGDVPFIKHNEFNLNDTWTVDTPWRSKAGDDVSDVDSIRILDWLVTTKRLEVTTEKIENVVMAIADRNTFHPVRDYLNGLKWDGKPRIDNWLRTYLDAKGPKYYLTVVGRKTLVAMVARIFEPGCEFHHVLILEGIQRRGKSQTFKILAAPWHNDTDLNVKDKDGKMQIQGVWVMEMSELTAFNRADATGLKSFIASGVDRFRRPYGGRMENFKRQSIFVGTTNDDKYLNDPTGNTRFWPVKIERLKRDALIRDRDQLLAEAMHFYTEYYKTGIESINYHEDDADFIKEATAQQDRREQDGDIESLVEEVIVNGVGVASINNVKCFRMVDILKAVGNVPTIKSPRALEMKIGNALTALGYVKSQFRFEGVRAWWWVPKND